MKTVNFYMRYVYILLGVVLIGVIIVLLVRLSKLMKSVSSTVDRTGNIMKNLEADKEKIDAIQKSKDSWTFFLSLYAIFVVLKEAFRNRKREDSFAKSLAHSGVRHAKQLSKIRF